MKKGSKVLVNYNGENQTGEYTGYSHMTKLHYVSLYNGATVRRKDLSSITNLNEITNGHNDNFKVHESSSN